MWHLTPGQTLRFRQFDADIVLYNDLSGDTHLLGDGAVHVLGVLQHGPAADAGLRASLAAALGAEHGPDFDEEADTILGQLASLFLIERRPC